ncbi:MAG: UvrD-helicase domain-containing protein [Bacteroidaceae bacterium]|nr:UvrD-helicase domain-containing protein [Bacteroidaceae bacterium]
MSHPLTVYKASAGSGKTFTLAVQYMKLLVLAQSEAEYAHILGVTFTNKATTEMKDRIISQLYGIGKGLPDSDNYLNALRKALQDEPDAPTSDEEIRRRCRRALHQILHDYSRFRVQTIDAFFQTILRGLAHELSLTANLQVEISDTEVLSEAVDRIIDRLQDEPVVLDWLLSLVRDQIENNQRWDVTRRVKEFGRTIFNEDYLMRGDQLRSVLSDGARVRSLLQGLRQQEQDALELVHQLGVRIEKAVQAGGVDYGDFSYGGQLASFVERLKAGQFADIELSTRIQTWADDPLTMVKKADQRSRPELVDVADEVSSILAEVVAQLPKLLYTVNSVRLASAHIKPLFLLDFIDREVTDINAETFRFNLAKTPILLSRMVGESDAPFIFEKMGALIHHVMIDEFQDTSRLQWHNFRVLLLESFSRGGRNLLVGDVKQSIYRWRGGDWRMLANIQKEMVPTPDVYDLNTNFRSMRNVVHFNNDFFTAAFQAMDAVSQAEETALDSPDFFRQAYADVEQQVPAWKGEEGYVRVTVLSPETYRRREDWEPVILDDLKQQIRTLHNAGLPYEEMTILVRYNSDCAPIIAAFAADPEMPPIISDEAFLLSSSLAVTLLIEALRLLTDKDNRVSPYYIKAHGFDPEVLVGQREQLCMMPLYELLEHLYRVLDLQRIPGQDAYLFGFFDAVTDFLHTDVTDIHAFLTYWDEKLSRQAIPAGQVRGIRVITIHKAKGLEFHTVLMPFCTWAFERDRSSDLLWCSPSEAPFSDFQLLPITPSSKMAPNSVFSRDYAEEHLFSRLDELNTLYVGFTRARSNLFVWSVGDDLQRDSRTVGDLLSCCVGEVMSGKDGIFSMGVPVTSKEETSLGEENRMMPRRTPFPVSMQSYDLSVAFRQSNRSQQFLRQYSDKPSSEGGGEDGQQRLYLETGRLLHKVLQSIHTVDDVPHVLDSFEHEGLVSRTLSDGVQVTVRRSDIERWLSRGFRNPLVSRWFSSDWQLFNECSIVSMDANGAYVTHRPDRVMVSPDNQHITVVDFKFGHPSPLYDAQVLGYMNLLCHMYPDAKVEGYLWFVYAGRVCPVDPTPQLTMDF